MKFDNRRVYLFKKTTSSHEISILRTIKSINKNLIQYLGISSSIA